MKVELVVQDKPDLQITLSNEEAHALLAVIYWVGGSPSGPRGIIDTLIEKLRDHHIATEGVYNINGIVMVEEMKS